jgi:hypothetical protein
MLLTRQEVEVIRKVKEEIDYEFAEDIFWFKDIDSESSLERREWKEKAKRLGFSDE